MSRTLSAALGFVLLAAIGGCSDPYEYVTVTGTVLTCEGKPAEGGTIVFWPVDEPDKTGRSEGNPGKPAQATIKADGTFELSTPTPDDPTHGRDGAVTGSHTVEFRMPPTKRPELTPGEAEAMNLTQEQVAKVEAGYAATPIYPKLNCSDVLNPNTVEVKADGENHFEFKLEPK